MPGLGTSFGRGGATTAQQDLVNADCILIEGSSMAEAHPVGFRWVMAAKERGAKIIHVDPRFSRTSAVADLWIPIRAGSDIAFLGGLIHYVLEHEKFFREYLVHFTNAPTIIRADFKLPRDDGFFSGWDEEHHQYDRETWMYQSGDLGNPERDLTLQNPRCVFQLLRQHYAPYTPEMVEKVCGIPKELFERAAETLTSASGPDKTGAITYAVGWTHHSKGVQIIRTASVLQLILGNIGRPGGGILALRGHASIQGSTDIPTLYDILPGYLAMPRAGSDKNLQDYIRNHRPKTGLWADYGNYAISLLKAYYGVKATADNEFGFQWLPKLTTNHSFFPFLYEMLDGRVEGFFVMGQNPAVGAQNACLQRKALAKLKWLVVRDLVEIETASFWLNSPEIERGELKTEEIQTEVFLFPCAAYTEKEGSFTNTQRMIQYREKAVEPAEDQKSETWFIHQLALRLKAKAEASSDPMHEAIRALDWWYPEDEHGEPRVQAILAEINGWKTTPSANAERSVWIHDQKGRAHHGEQLESYNQLKDDGSTAAGCWIYTGIYGPDKINRALRREPKGPYGHGWGWAWPSDRRILYNRASARPDGTPWSDRKKLVWWDAERQKWVGNDVADFVADKPPDYVPPEGATGLKAHPGDRPFILHEDGLGWIFVAKGLEDGPFPAHYEPLESLVHNAIYRRDTNPPVTWFTRADNRFAPPNDPRFPYILTTYRLTEHHTAGGMSRWLSHLSELMPAFFVELSPELAAELRIAQGADVIVLTIRAAVQAKALITRRLRPLKLESGRVVHQVGMPFHWGGNGLSKGDSANDLLAISGEPNVTIMETKAITCAVVPGRLPEGPAYLEFMAQHVPPGGSENLHPEQPPPGTTPGGKSIMGQAQHGKSE